MRARRSTSGSPAGKGPDAALVAIDPRDGRVLAMVGGEDFDKSQFNLAVQGQRQTGSAFKPFVLTAAVDQGISPQTEFTSEPTVINLGDKLWSVGNYEGSYLGRIDLEEATIHSDNSVYAQLTAQVGPKSVADMAHKLGVTRPLDDYFAIGLGVEAVSPLEMARAFSTLANGGQRIDGSVLGNVPRAVLRVEDGRNADVNDPVEKRAVDSNDSSIVTSILQDVVTEGTGQRAGLDDRPVAGKTGTTENYGDAWFVGYTPQLAVAVWVGYPNRLKPMETEFEGGPVAGGSFPALIWKSFAGRALDHLEQPPKSFPYPSYESVVARQVVYRDNKMMLDNGNCEGVREILYFVGTGPEAEADCKPNEVDVPNVVGSRLAAAKKHLYSIPLTPEVIWRPARAGEQLGVVIAQKPESGARSSWSTVRIVSAPGPARQGAGRRRPGCRQGATPACRSPAGGPADLPRQRAPRRRPRAVPAGRASGDSKHDRSARHRALETSLRPSARISRDKGGSQWKRLSSPPRPATLGRSGSPEASASRS